ARGLDVYINLIPWNPVEGRPFTSPSAQECRDFVSRLEKAGLNVSMRTRRGTTIGGACGQLGKSSVDEG
ncbi:MAG: 23S rRNA (adenine(2503)-C2)-methyltransferase, partial [Treponema sp.]|nr:23S rRNA (adenine(2503)-C2)-methyltransferase [Treponema sp.]